MVVVKKQKSISFNFVHLSLYFVLLLLQNVPFGSGEGIELKKCSACEKIFSSRLQLVKHLEEYHHGDNSELFLGLYQQSTETKGLQYFYSSPTNTVNHSEHFNKRKFVNKHVNPLEKNHVCPYCPYKTFQKCDLTKHIRIHSGERPFKCPLCDYSASQKSSLNTHIRIHTGEKPFKCDHCDYVTAHYSSLYNHKKIHISDKNF